MATKTQKIRVGLFTATAGALLAIVVVVFGGMRFWEDRSHYTILFEGSVYGLDRGAHVYLNGVRVGSVSELGPALGDPRKVQVEISVRADTPIRTDTRAIMQFAGITGLKVIDLRGGTPSALALPDGGEIPPGETILDKVEEQGMKVIERSTAIMERAQQVLDNLATLTEPAQLKAIVTSVRATADNLAESSAALRTIVGENRVALRASIDAVSQAAKKTSDILDTEVARLVTTTGDVVASVKGLVSGNEGPLRAAVFDLRQASRSFKELAREVRQRPSRLLFSSAPDERKLP